MPGNRALALFALASLLLAVPVALAQVPPEAPIVEPLAQPVEEQAEEQAEGSVKAVDVENNTLTISTVEGEELLLNVTDNTSVTENGIEELGMGPSGLEQIAEGDRVSVSYNKDTMEATSIDVLSAEAEPAEDQPILPEELEIQPPEEPAEEEVSAPAEEGGIVEGRVTGVNTNSNILVVQTPEGKYLAFRLADDTSVVSGEGREAGIEALSYGVNVSVKYDEQTKNAVEVVVFPALEASADEQLSLPEAPETQSPEEEVPEEAPVVEPLAQPTEGEITTTPTPEENVTLEP